VEERTPLSALTGELAQAKMRKKGFQMERIIPRSKWIGIIKAVLLGNKPYLAHSFWSKFWS